MTITGISGVNTPTVLHLGTQTAGYIDASPWTLKGYGHFCSVGTDIWGFNSGATLGKIGIIPESEVTTMSSNPLRLGVPGTYAPDQHCSGVAMSVGGVGTAYSLSYTDAIDSASGSAQNPTGPGQNEVLMIAPGAKGSNAQTSYRFMHSMNDASADMQNFQHLTTGNVDVNGKVACFQTDWNQALGQDNGGRARSYMICAELR